MGRKPIQLMLTYSSFLLAPSFGLVLIGLGTMTREQLELASIEQTKELQSALQESNRQVIQSKSIPVDGTGLGLALVKRIIEAHHSKVEVESEPGHGSVFFFDLPLVVPR
jgi:K+-sensing histidine kinase KdpD